jgi:Rrf2 family protein
VRVSRRGLYALRALLHLAGTYEQGLARIHDIARAEGIPEKFLESILVLLRNARFVVSRRGREGGYRLRLPPREIRIGDVIRAVDGPLAPFGDAVELAQRARAEKRHPALFARLLDVRNAAAAILDGTSLSDLLERDRRLLSRRS